MAFLCKDLFRMKTLSELELVAGEGGLYNKVTWTYIGENSNVSEWGKGGEVMFITGIGMDRSEKGLFEIVKNSIDRNLSGLVVSKNQNYINEIPDIVKAYADEKDFPIFFIPWSVKRIDVSKEIALELIGEQQKEHMENELVYLLKKRELSIEDQERVRNLLKPYNVDSSLKFVVLAFEPVDKTLVVEKLLFFIREEMSKQVISGRTVLLADEKRAYLFYYRQHPLNNLEANELAENILRKVKKQCGDIIIGICTSKIKESEAMKASIQSIKIHNRIQAYKSKNEKGMIVTFENLGILRIVYENIKHPVMRNYYNEVIHKLVEYDENVENYMVDTVVAYFENMYNISKTAEALYIHRNSLMYRLNKIEELTGIDMKNPYALADLAYAAIAHKYMTHPL